MDKDQHPESKDSVETAAYNPLHGLKHKLEQEMQKRIHNLYTILDYDGRESELEAVLLPTFTESEDGNDLVISSKCDVSSYLYQRLSSAFGNVVTESAPKMLATALKSDQVNVGLSMLYQGDFSTIKISLSSKDRPGIMLSAEYMKKYKNDHASMKVTISKSLANYNVAYDVYMKLWQTVVADISRLADIIVTEKDEEYEYLKDFGLDLYKGGTNIEAIGGYKNIKEKVERDVFFRFKNTPMIRKVSELAMKSKYDPINAILFYGPPGTGKTLMARMIASEQKIDFVKLSLSTIFDKYYSMSQRQLDDALNVVEEYSRDKKVVLFIDEIDFLGRRGGGNQSTDHEDTRVLDNLLMWLDGMNSKRGNDNLLVIGSTNFIEGVDPALNSRFKSRIYFPLPAKEDRYEIFKIYAKHLSDDELKTLAENSDGMSGRDIAAASFTAVTGWSMYLKSNKEEPSPPPIKYYVKAIDEFRSSIDAAYKPTSKTANDIYA